MLTQEQTQLMRILQSLITLTECEAIEVVHLFQNLTLNQNDFWIRAGEIPQTIGFVTSGILRLYCADANGNEFTKSFCAENSFIAAYSALLLKETSHLFIQALEDTTLQITQLTDRCQNHV
ncbi:MAG TPA: cyclic nucleotide-binding domain-containing protein [Crinalium sp.]|jgi:CRP-like cAMP-binding protein